MILDIIIIILTLIIGIFELFNYDNKSLIIIALAIALIVSRINLILGWC